MVGPGIEEHLIRNAFAYACVCPDQFGLFRHKPAFNVLLLFPSAVMPTFIQCD